MDLDAATICWDDANDPGSNWAHITPTGLTQGEIEDVIRDPALPVQRSRGSGLPCKVGPAADGRLMFVSGKVESDDPPAVSPVTAYYLSQPWSHPLDNIPPGVRLSGGRPDRGPITITPEQLAESRRLAAEARAMYGPNPRLEDMLDPDQIAVALAALPPPAVAALKAARVAAGLSPAEAAARAGVPEAAVGQVDSGRLADVTWSTLDRYAAAVGLTLTLTASPAK